MWLAVGDFLSTFAPFHRKRKISQGMFRITTITKNLLIINALMFIATWVFARQGVDLGNLLGLHFVLAPNFNVLQLLTYMFMHANFQHLFFNMFALWMFGCVVEDTLGPRRFLVYYFVCGIGAGLMQEIAQFGEFYQMACSQVPGFSIGDTVRVAQNSSRLLSLWTTVGASGAVYSILLAFGMLFPDNRIFIFPLPVPIKAKWFVCVYILVELWSAIAVSNDNVAHYAHLGGMLFGWLLMRHWRDNPGGGNYGRHRGQQFFDSLRSNWERRSNRKADPAGGRDPARGESDWDYNARRKREQDEIDRILDKVRRSGYDSLTEEEKKKLFDGGKR